MCGGTTDQQSVLTFDPGSNDRGRPVDGREADRQDQYPVKKYEDLPWVGQARDPRKRTTPETEFPREERQKSNKEGRRT